MQAVRRILHPPAGVEKISVPFIKRTLDREGVPTPSGREYWHWRIIRYFIMHDVYKPHTFEEIEELVSSEVASRLDPDKLYGVWWYNRQRVTRTQVSEVGSQGRTYRKRGRYSIKDRNEWIAVPVPDAGIPREVVKSARQIVLDFRKATKTVGRFWELSGSIIYCAVCSRVMNRRRPAIQSGRGRKATSSTTGVRRPMAMMANALTEETIGPTG